MRWRQCPLACPVASSLDMSISGLNQGFPSFRAGTDLPLSSHLVAFGEGGV